MCSICCRHVQSTVGSGRLCPGRLSHLLVHQFIRPMTLIQHPLEEIQLRDDRAKGGGGAAINQGTSSSPKGAIKTLGVRICTLHVSEHSWCYILI